MNTAEVKEFIRTQERFTTQVLDNQRREINLRAEHIESLIEVQNKFNETILRMMGEYLENCATLFEKALNPPLPVIEPTNSFIENNPRMSEEEEDLRYARSVGDITDTEFEQRLSKYTDGAYME